MSRVFWDTNLFIYLLEDTGRRGGQVAALRERMLARGDILVTSSFTLGEVLVKPIEAQREDLRSAYERALLGAAEIVDFDRRAAVLYARLRQDRSIRPPDAIQLACAGAASVDLFITNDDRLSRKAAPGVHFVSALDRAPI